MITLVKKINTEN